MPTPETKLLNLKIGVFPHKKWSSKVLWLLHEFGYPAELIQENVQNYPLVIIPYAVLAKERSVLSYRNMRYNSLLVACTDDGENVPEYADPIIPIVFGSIRCETGCCKVPKEENPLSNIFPHRQLKSEARRDSKLKIKFTELRISSNSKVIVSFENDQGNSFPLLACGSMADDRKFAAIAAGNEILECHDSNWGPLLYLAAVEWCLSGLPFARKWFWPNATRMVIALSFDLEGFPKFRKNEHCLWSRYFDRLLLRWAIKRILKFLNNKSVPSTWFVPGSQATRTPNLVKMLLSDELIEVAGHGDLHYGIDKLAKRFDEDTSNVQKQRLGAMKKAIEKVARETIKGFRAPGLHADHNTLLALQENDFTWDCTASPVTNYLMRWFFFPYNPILDWESEKELDIIEIPVIGPWERYCPVHDSMHSSREYLEELCEDFNFLYSVGGLQTLLIHPLQIAIRPYHWKAVKSFVTEVLKYNVCFLTCSEIAHVWALRKDMGLEATYNYETSTIQLYVKKAEPNLSIQVYIPRGYRVSDVLLEGTKSIPFECWKDSSSIVFVTSVRGNSSYRIQLSKTNRVPTNSVDCRCLRQKEKP